jgi:hypothetical protein
MQTELSSASRVKFSSYQNRPGVGRPGFTFLPTSHCNVIWDKLLKKNLGLLSYIMGTKALAMG